MRTEAREFARASSAWIGQTSVVRRHLDRLDQQDLRDRSVPLDHRDPQDPQVDLPGQQGLRDPLDQQDRPGQSDPRDLLEQQGRPGRRGRQDPSEQQDLLEQSGHPDPREPQGQLGR